MLHIVPILCILLFIGLVEYRLKQHLDEVDKRLANLEGYHRNSPRYDDTGNLLS